MRSRGKTWLKEWRRLSLRLGIPIAVLVGAQSIEADAADNREAGQGAQIYKQNGCSVCHGGIGTGAFGPKLSGDPMLAIDQYVIAQILIGRGQMPAFQDKLSDRQIAEVAQFIRNNWGNDFGPISEKEVADTRRLMERATKVSARAAQAQQ